MSNNDGNTGNTLGSHFLEKELVILGSYQSTEVTEFLGKWTSLNFRNLNVSGTSGGEKFPD